MTVDNKGNMLFLHSEIEDLKMELSKAIAVNELLLGVSLQEYSALNLYLNLSLLMDLLISIEERINFILKGSKPNS